MAAWVKGGAADTDAAVQAAAELLAGARAPVFAGLCADLSAVRAAYRLAEAIGASCDPVSGPSLYAELGALSTGGSMTTTSAEAIGRADTVLVVGQRPWHGDLVTDIARVKPVRGRAAGSDRAILSLGGPQNGDVKHVAYGAGNAGLAASLGHLRAYVRGNLAGGEALGDLASRLSGAQYGVVLYDSAEIGESGVEMLQGLVKDLNETTRFFALGLADPFQGRAVLQLSAWTTGQAPRVGFGRGQPEHDPWRFDSSRQVEAGEADAALWLAALPAPRPSWLGTIPTVAIVGEGSAESRGDTAQVVIGVGVPGESSGGSVWNERRGVIGYVLPKGEPAGASAADILKSLHDRLTHGKVA